MARAHAILLSLAALLCLNAAGSHGGGLLQGFYNGKCKGVDVESTIQKLVAARYTQDQTIVPAILRMLFHDCFVRGCDASLLLNGPGTEKTAIPNQSVRGYDLIDEIKAALEKACPGVVSCADIISAATRDCVVLGGGGSYNVLLGRRDGTVSHASEALADLPKPTITVPQAISAFQSKGLSATDLVLLLGGHTVGIAHCAVISGYIYSSNINATMDPTLLASLRKTCPRNSTSNRFAFLDQATPTKVDNAFYGDLVKKRGILPIDEALFFSSQTSGTVKSLASGALNFRSMFGQSLVNLGSVGVLTGTQGVIRKVCSSPNPASPSPLPMSPPPPAPKKSPPPPAMKKSPPPPAPKKSPPPPPPAMKKSPPPPAPKKSPPPPPPAMKKSPPPPAMKKSPPPAPKKKSPHSPKKARRSPRRPSKPIHKRYPPMKHHGMKMPWWYRFVHH